MALNVTYRFNGGSESGPRDGWEVRLVAGLGDVNWNSTQNLALKVIQTTPVNYIFFEPSVYGTSLLGSAIYFTPGTPSPPTYVYNDPETSASNRSNYINYRQTSNWSSHPTTGFSFDLWFAQSTFPSQNQNYASGTWSWGIVNNQTYSLRSDRYTVFYQYNDQVINGVTYRGPFAWGWQKGGTVNILCTLDNL